MARNPHLARLRRMCLALPEAHEKVAWGAPTLRVNDKLFAHYRNDHHGDGRVAAWCKALPDEQLDLVESDPERFFVPPYVGPSGWVGIGLDRKPDWGVVAELLEHGYRLVAPRRLVAELDRAGVSSAGGGRGALRSSRSRPSCCSPPAAAT